MTEIPISRKPRIATRRKREVVVVTGATGMLIEVKITIRVTMDVVIHRRGHSGYGERDNNRYGVRSSRY